MQNIYILNNIYFFYFQEYFTLLIFMFFTSTLQLFVI